MASTVKLTSELAARTAHAVTQDVESWKQYLTTASRLYKQTRTIEYSGGD